MLSTSPSIPKIREGKRWELSCDTGVFQRRFVCTVQDQEWWVAVGRGGAGGAALLHLLPFCQLWESSSLAAQL